MKNESFKKLFCSILLLLVCPWTSAGDIGTEEAETEIVIGGAEETVEGLELTEEESQICATDVVGEIIADKLPEEIPPLALVMATALRDRCQCDAVAVRTMTEAGVPFNEAFNTIVEVCELDGTELGELSRALGPGLGDADRGPGGEISP